MALNLYCEHRHRLTVPDLAAAPSKILCPLCGTVADVKSQVETEGVTLDRTLVSKSSAASAPVKAPDKTQSVDEARDSSLNRTHHLSNAADSVKSQPSQQSRSESGSNGYASGNDLGAFVPPRPTGYEIIKEIGRGGMGVVYLAREESTGRHVALKTLQRLDPERLQQFKQEFRALADISHPHLAAIYELLSDGNTWCFSMELLEGVEILEYIWSGFDKLQMNAESHVALLSDGDGSRLSLIQLRRLAEAFEQLLVGLHALHQAGKLHSDIKPSNVLMTKEQRLVLLDFGLIGNIYQPGKRRTHGTIRGTPGYMSPEQSVGGSLTAASDMYAVGVVLYEVLTGHRPFRGKVSQVLAQKQKETPVAPIVLEPSVPRELNDLCMALLERDPARRPDAIRALRCIGANAPADTLVSQELGPKQSSVHLVGRQRHLELLQRAFSQVLAGDTLSVFVHGRSGMGKSVLVRKFLEDIRFRYEAVVLQGRCYEQESVPFKTLDSMIDSLADYLDALPEGQVRALMPRDRLALIRVFPVLGRIQDAKRGNYPSIENADQQELRQRAVNALRELLQRLAIDVPLVLYIDDLQWGDVDSADLLADLVRPPDAPRMLLLGSYRSEDVGVSLSLQAVDEAFKKGQQPPHREELAVESLTEEESTQLALMLLGDDREPIRLLLLIGLVQRETQGLLLMRWLCCVWQSGFC